ncbi:Alpha/Beta hydrolase protein [Bombardia bombarda]|uniref:Alpha/Beta hydrolase protein n=1 Tax=Bombardia bombarda TaxID=252184 RepID=A0AA39WUL1_9PEZI|nr:Alpha/Beta hydrolase protein [Bombardia bombarda]
MRLRNATIAFILQKLILGPISFIITLKRDYLLPPSLTSSDPATVAAAAILPTLVKTYPIRKKLPVRIFYPRSYDHAQKNGPRLPVLMTLHGGGFAMGSPPDNDAWNASFASRHGFLVVGLNYAKAPGSPFPGPVYDVEALIGCVLADTSLPIDASRVALAGWSAGGNLILSAAQLKSVRDRVRAVVPLYPVVDFGTLVSTKLGARRWKPTLGGFRGKDSDYLTWMTPIFQWAYLNEGQRPDDPLLSPIHATREMLPRNVFMIGCELDQLCQEGWRMICGLAGRRVPGKGESPGREEVGRKGELVLEGDERFAFEERTAEGGRYRWLLVPDAIHGFDQNIRPLVRGEVEVLEDGGEKTERVIGEVGEWLKEGVFK